MLSGKGSHGVKETSLTGMRGYLAYPVSSRQREELLQERGGAVEHATINRCKR